MLSKWRIALLGALFFTTLHSLVQDPLHHRLNWTFVDNPANETKVIEDIIKGLSATGNNKSAEAEFVLGAASAEYQILGSCGCPHSQMAHGEKHMTKTEQSRFACGGLEQHFRDIALLEQCNLTAYRFSIDWSLIEPFEGDWNHEIVDHYVAFCQELKRRNIKVMVTLHHFVHPQWFEERGAFAVRENITYFVKFCRLIYRSLAPYVDWVCTINEPGVYILQTLIRGVFPPFKSVVLPGFPFIGFRESWSPLRNASYNNIKLAGETVHNLLLAHVEVYNALKSDAKVLNAMYGRSELRLDPQIGFAHQYLKFSPFHDSSGNFTGILGRMEGIVADLINKWTNWSIMDCLEHEKFSFPGTTHTETDMPGINATLDWIGLNYYSVVFLSFSRFGPGYYPGDIHTGMPYGVYAEGLRDALEHCVRLKKPIYITENGVDDRIDDSTRSLWIKRHLWIIAQARSQGADIRGFFYWCLLDNWEWDMGYGPKFGLYHVDFNDNNLPRRFKSGSRIYKEIAGRLLQQQEEGKTITLRAAL